MIFFAQQTFDLQQSTDLTTSTGAPSAGAAAGIGIGLIVLYLVLAVFYWVCAAKIYMKANRQWWEAIVPIYSTYVLQKIVGRPGWWTLLYFIPLVNVVVAIINIFDLVKAFGRGVGTGLALLFLPIIMYPIMAFGSSYKYQGSEGTSDTGPVPPPAGGNTTPGGAVAPQEGNDSAGIAAGAAGGAAVSSGLSDQPATPTPAETVADSSSQDQNTDAEVFSPDSSSDGMDVAQAPSAPVEESPADTSDITEASSTPEGSSYQSGSTGEEQEPASDGGLASPPPETPQASDEGSNPDNSNDDAGLSDDSGPSIG